MSRTTPTIGPGATTPGPSAISIVWSRASDGVQPSSRAPDSFTTNPAGGGGPSALAGTSKSLPKLGEKPPALEHLDAIGLEEVVVDGHELDAAHRLGSGAANDEPVVVERERRVVRRRDAGHAGDLLELRPQGRPLAAHAAQLRPRQHHDFVFVEAEIEVAREAGLLVDDGRAHEQRDRDRELRRHEHVAEARAGRAARHVAFEHLRGAVSREIERRVAARPRRRRQP